MIAHFAYRLADWIVRTLPSGAVNVLARAVARAAFVYRRPVRRQLELNLAQLDERCRCSPRARTRRARESFENFALSLTDLLRLPRVRAELSDRVEVCGREHLHRARRSGRGVIVLSAHVGNWEWGAAFLAAAGTRIHVAARPHPDPAVDAFFRGRRDACGVASLEPGASWVAAAQALRRNEWVAVMGDRGLPGRSTSVCAWAAALARRTGAILLPAVMLRLEDGRYAACFEPPLTPEACTNGGYLAAMRRHLDRDPAQWFAFEPLPEGLAS